MAAGRGMSGRVVICSRLSSPLPLWERVARIARCETGEGFVSADRDSSSAFFSHKGRREESHTRTAVFGQYLSSRCRFTSLPVAVVGRSAATSMLRGHFAIDSCYLKHENRSAVRTYTAR